MHFQLFPASTYINRRQQLSALLPDSLILLMGNEETGMNYRDNVYPFRQDSSFLYYFGLDTPGLAALIDTAKNETIIFGNELSMDDIIWTGPLPSIKEMANMVGVHKTQSYAQLATYLQNKASVVKYLPPYRNANLIRIAEWLQIPLQEVSARASTALIKAVVSQRMIKDQLEVAAIDEAVSISTDMHLAAMQITRPGMKEYEVAGKMMEVAYGAGGRLSYNIICSKDGHILHNHYQGNTLAKGDLLLIDAGAEQAMHYAGDLTRTFPVGTKFSALQKSLYNIVLRSIETASNMLAPGVRYIDVHAKAGEVLLQGLKEIGVVTGDPAEAVQQNVHTLFFQCGLGHMMGLDVHDMEDLGEPIVGYTDSLKKRTDFGWKSLRLGRELQKGLVLTVEPGLYFIPELIDRWKAENKLASFVNYTELEKLRHFGGIRIENNFLITDKGHQLLGKPLVMTAEAVEDQLSLG